MLLENLSEKQYGTLWAAAMAAAVILSPWGIGFVLLLLVLWPKVRQQAGGAVFSGLMERDALLLRILVFLVPVAFYVLASPPPPDDLLREMTAFLHGYDYQNLYWASPRLLSGDTSYWWSRGLKYLVLWLPQKFAFLPVQYALVIGWAAVIPLVLRAALRYTAPKLTGAWPWIWVALGSSLIWALPDFTSRIIQARPENLGALLSFSAFLVDGTVGVWVWTIIMALWTPLYWLSGIYAMGAWLMRVPPRTRAISFFVLCLVFGAYWVSGWQLDWLRWFFGMRQAIAHRVASVGENSPMYMWLIAPTFGVLAALLALAFSAPKNPVRYWLPAILVAVWFCLPNMIRYMDDVGPLLVLTLFLLPSENVWEWLKIPAVPPLALLLLFFFVPSGMNASTMPNLHIPGAKAGQRVLATLGPEEYYALYQNPELKFAPACELGYTRRAIQNLGLDLLEAGGGEPGIKDCSLLRKYHVSWVAEKNVVIDRRDGLRRCLRLVFSRPHGYEVWRVLPEVKNG